ncbi:MAG TPA: DUF1801 domain-containing protein [Ferruginibacter sp.]|nr:DUF1801 domain-containing protein [Ferruginibacter sp.]
MAKYKAKTTENKASVSAFIKTIPDLQKQKDSFALIEIMKKQSGFEPKLWGPAIIGFGKCHFKYESGHEGDMPLIGFSPRKAALTLYLAMDFEKKEELLKKLGKHKTSYCCLYVKKLEDIDTKVLEKMITNSIKSTDQDNAAC